MMIEDVVEKEAYSRPGYTLAAFKEAALPLYVLTARVITLEKKPLSPIEEGCLRAVEAGLSSPEDICAFLGLPMQVLKGILAGLNSTEQINYSRPTGCSRATVVLTDKGRVVLTQVKTITPEERIVPIVYDPLLKKVVFIPTNGLFRPKEVKEKGWLEIPPCDRKRPEVDDIPLSDIDKVIQRLPRGQDEIRELLAIRGIERRELQFTPAAALYFRSNSGKEVQVAFYREDGFSVGHETAFSEMDGPERIGANYVLQPPDVAGLVEAVSAEDLVASLSEVDALERTIAAAEAAFPDPSRGESAPSCNEQVKKSAEDAKRRLKAMTQRPLRCHDHPKLLRDALSRTTDRLLIVSPWINDQVVDDMFVRSLEALLRNGVDVAIGYGLADEGRGKQKDKAKQKDPISPNAKKELEGLRKQFKNFSLKFVGNTHRKLLVSDARFAVVTSFNWLSFKGDPKKKARDEYGLLISDPDMLEKVIKDGLALIADGYDHPPATRDVTDDSRH